MKERDSTMTTSTRNFITASNLYEFAANMMNACKATNDTMNYNIWKGLAEWALEIMGLNLA